MLIKLGLLLIVALLAGCASIDKSKNGRPSLKWVLSTKHGCEEKISVKGKKVAYSVCF